MTEPLDPELRTLRTTLLLTLGTLPIMYPDCPYNVFQRHGLKPEEVPEAMMDRAQVILSNPGITGRWHEWLQMATDMETEALAKVIEAEAEALERSSETLSERTAGLLQREPRPEVLELVALLRETADMPRVPMRVTALRLVAGVCCLAYDPRKADTAS